MSRKKLGLAVIGKPHLAPIGDMAPYAEYVAGCDLVESFRDEARQRHGVATFADYREMLEHPDVDVVYVKTPNHVHAEPTLAALAKGKHVFCEKPLALNMDDCRRMVDAARENDRLLQVDLELRSSTIARRIHEIVHSGEIGEGRRLLFHHYQGAWDEAADHWRMNPETSGGIFLEKLVHEVDLFRWFLGEIEAVQSFTTPNVLPQSWCPDFLQSMFWFRSGAMGSMLHTQTRSAQNVDPALHPQCGHELGFDVVGTKGSMKADVWSGRITVFHFGPGRAEGTLVPHFARHEDYGPLGFHRLGHDTDAHLAEFLRRILAGEPEQQSPDDVLKTMATTFAAEESVRSGERVEVVL